MLKNAKLHIKRARNAKKTVKTYKNSKIRQNMYKNGKRDMPDHPDCLTPRKYPSRNGYSTDRPG